MENLLPILTLGKTQEDKDLIEKAYFFAQEKHGDQKRNSGEPYFSHVAMVAKNCVDLGMDTPTILGALLHDTLEDTEATEEEIEAAFGAEVLFLVKGVTKLGKLKYQGRERHVESLRKFFVAVSEDLRVMIIKLADRLHNVQTLEHVPRPDKRARIALETIQVHASLAERLGMEKLKGLLEDYSFPFAYPKEYEKTKKIMEELVPEATKVIDYAHKEIEKTLHDFGLHNMTVTSRIKNTYSTYRKLQKYNWNTEQIYDIVALRVLTHSVSDCYQVLGLIHALWKPIPKRIKDFIALPKPNGYQSLHTTVITDHGVIEIQIRTEEMHRESEMGVAAHFLYKEEELSKKKNRQRKLSWIDELKELHDVVKNPSKFLEQLRVDFFSDRIFVFTPQGDVIDLPQDASPIDFAYAVHTDIGNSTSSARINGKIAPLGAKLQNGDIVQIITTRTAHPSSKWLKYAKTSFARKKIRHYIEEHGGLIEKFLVME
jgi:GTP pyrophosphokinase